MIMKTILRPMLSEILAQKSRPRPLKMAAIGDDGAACGGDEGDLLRR